MFLVLWAICSPMPTLNSAVVTWKQRGKNECAELCSNKTLFMDAEISSSCNFYMSQNIILVLTSPQLLKREKPFLVWEGHKTRGGLDLAPDFIEPSLLSGSTSSRSCVRPSRLWAGLWSLLPLAWETTPPRSWASALFAALSLGALLQSYSCSYWTRGKAVVCYPWKEQL